MMYDNKEGKGMDRKKGRKLTIWEVFDEYADIRDSLGDLVDDFYVIQEEVGTAIMELSDGLDDICERLCQCDRTFRRYRVQPEPPQRMKYKEMPEDFEEEELPFHNV